MTLMLVTDCRRACPDARTDRDLVTGATGWLAEAVGAGVDQIQVRERSLSTATVAGLVRAIVAAARGTSTRVLVNDRADVASVTGADGVHLRDDGWPARRVRALAPRPWLIGRSVHDVPDASADVADLDYVLFGAVFSSGVKRARGFDGLAAVAASSPVPVLAIGGIHPGNAAACLAAGASGLAAISVFLPPGCAPGSLGPRDAVRRLRAAAGVPV